MKSKYLYLAAFLMLGASSFGQKIKTFTDARDGQEYSYVKIGDQFWMTENLNYYLPEGSIYYDLDSLTNSGKYGCLYTWPAAMGLDPIYRENKADVVSIHQGVCPDEWHMPTDEEWQQLESELGMSKEDLQIRGYRGDIAGKLKPGGKSGFNALYSGDADYLETGYDLGDNAFYWTATQIGANLVYMRGIYSAHNKIYRNDYFKYYYMAVRCVKN